MDSPIDVVENVIKEVDGARTTLAMGSARQITQAATLDYLNQLRMRGSRRTARFYKVACQQLN